MKYAEITQQKGYTGIAITELRKIRYLAVKEGKKDLAREAIKYIVRCFFQLFSEEGDWHNIRQAKDEIKNGSELSETPLHESVFLLLGGDIAIYEKDFKKAETLYEEACRLGPKGNFTEQEYLAHLARALVLNYKPCRAVDILLPALQWVQEDRVTEHWLILATSAGMRLTLAKAAWQLKMFTLSAFSFAFGLWQAYRLHKVFHMSLPLRQYGKQVKQWL